MSSDNGKDIAGAVIGFGAGLYFFYRGLKRLHLARIIEALPTSKISSLALGTVEVCGHAEPLSQMWDPIYAQDCVYYDIKVEQKKGKHWSTIYEKNTNDHPFAIVDETGKAVVDPRGAENYFECDVNGSGGMLSGLDAPSKNFITNLGCSSWSSTRMCAKIVRAGDPLYVLGHASSGAPHPGLRNRIIQTGMKAALTLAEVARKLKANPSFMASLDANRDGTVDSEEWDNGLVRYQKELEKNPEQKNPISTINSSITIHKAPEGILVLADKCEKEFLTKLGRLAVFEIYGGPILTLACGAYLGTRLHLL